MHTRSSLSVRTLLASCLLLFCCTQAPAFVAFESGQVRPLALSPDGNRLFVVNTPDNTLEIFDVNNGSPVYLASVPVGLEPVAVAARSNSKVWVANYLSDSISIIDVGASPPRVTRTLLVGDEPADIVFAGPGGNRAFITTAHRGQNSPYTDPLNPGELTKSGIGRADIWVFDATNANTLGAGLGGTPETIVTLFGDTPKALTVSPDGNTVYAAVFKSGNGTTTLNDGVVCDGGDGVTPCTPTGTSEVTAPGGLPAPSEQTIGGIPQPETGLIVKYDGAAWHDEIGRDWSGLVRFNLPDKDVFAIDATADPPVETVFYTGVGTVLYNMAVNPVSGKIYVANTEAVNEVRFEGERPAAPEFGHDFSTVRGHLHKARITIIDPGTSGVTPLHLNKHIDYSVVPSPAGVYDDSLATPKGIAVTEDGNTLYVVAKGSAKVGVFNTAALEADTFVPDAASHIQLSGGGPGGLVLDEANDRLYVTTRFGNAMSVIDTTTNTEIAQIALHNPEPPSVIAGRQFLYDARLTSSNGEASCAACHVEGDKDELAWDLGDPLGSALNNPNPFEIGPAGDPDFHPMKGPMATQTLRAMATHGPMHWRGDRTGGNDQGGDPLDEDAAFKAFNGAFVGLLGRDRQLTTPEMQAFADFILQVSMPPNPIRALDDVLTPAQQAGRDYYTGPFLSDGVRNCDGCHVLDENSGFFGTDGDSSFEGEPQHMKIPQLRNMYEKVGMFGMPDTQFFNAGDNGHKGDQIRGFGFLHDGSVDTLFRFHDAALFNFTLNNNDPDVERANMEQFMFAFPTNLKPIVGQQITRTPGNNATAGPRIDLLVARALAGDADLVVKGILGGVQRGWHRKSDGSFESDAVAEAPLTEAALRVFADTAGQELTYTAVPPGEGNRIGIDRDEDGVRNFDDNCPTAVNPTQLDTDDDDLGNICDVDMDNDGLTNLEEQAIGTNTLLVDTDGDGMSDFEEANFDGNQTYTPGSDPNPLVADTDGDGLFDGSDPIPLLVNFNDGDVAPPGNLDTLVMANDYLVLMQAVIGTRPVTNEMLQHGDLHPVGAPDGDINMGDLIQLLKLVML